MPRAMNLTPIPVNALRKRTEFPYRASRYWTGVSTVSLGQRGAHTTQPIIMAIKQGTENNIHMLRPAVAALPAKPTKTTALYPETWWDMAAIHQGRW